jgi:hypothetical protein
MAVPGFDQQAFCYRSLAGQQLFLAFPLGYFTFCSFRLLLKGRAKPPEIYRTHAQARMDDINSMGSARESSLSFGSSFTAKKSINAQSKQIFTTAGTIQV